MGGCCAPARRTASAASALHAMSTALRRTGMSCTDSWRSWSWIGDVTGPPGARQETADVPLRLGCRRVACRAERRATRLVATALESRAGGTMNEEIFNL